MAKLLSALLFCAVLSIASVYVSADFDRTLHYSRSDHSKRYVNCWAVEVRGGKAQADEVARRHGFENRGQVSALRV